MANSFASVPEFVKYTTYYTLKNPYQKIFYLSLCLEPLKDIKNEWIEFLKKEGSKQGENQLLFLTITRVIKYCHWHKLDKDYEL